MDASRAIGQTLRSGVAGLSALRAAVNAAKVVLGKRGHGFWADSARNLARCMTHILWGKIKS